MRIHISKSGVLFPINIHRLSFFLSMGYGKGAREKHGLIHLLHGRHHKLHGFKLGLLIRWHEILELIQWHPSKGVIILPVVASRPAGSFSLGLRLELGLGLSLDRNGGTWYRAWIRGGVGQPKALGEVDNKVDEILFRRIRKGLYGVQHVKGVVIPLSFP